MATNESGFTLVELLVVMLIIGLLAAIAIPSFFNQRSKANGTSTTNTGSPSATAYRITVTAKTTLNTFSIDRAASGAVSFPCTVAVSTNRGGCPSSGLWN